MLKENNQLSFCLSSHASLYDILIEKNNFWRQLKDMVDFSFVYDELKDKYSSTILKSKFGYDTANACGKNGITIQGASALFLANIKRIIKLREEKAQNNG